MADTQASTLPWTFRLAERTRAPLLLVGLGVAVAYLCFFVLIHNLAGGIDGLRMEGQPFWLDPWGATAFTYSLAFGYMIIVVSHLMRFASARLRDLEPVLTLSASEIAEFDSGLRRIEPWRLRLAGAVGAGIATAVNVWLSVGVGAEARPQPWAWWMAFFFTQDFLWGWLSFRILAIVFAAALRFSRLGERHAVIDLFDFKRVRPFTRLGLHLALLVLIGIAINLFAMPGVFQVTDSGLFATYGGMMVGVPVIVGAVLLLLPLRGVHRAIVTAKSSDLERVRAEIAQEREVIDTGDGERKTAAALRLPGLLAYEARVERVREWSLDFPAFLRFALYVLIPLGSWVAAAFVERALGAALE